MTGEARFLARNRGTFAVARQRYRLRRKAQIDESGYPLVGVSLLRQLFWSGRTGPRPSFGRNASDQIGEAELP